MLFKDLETGDALTIRDLFQEWKEKAQEQPTEYPQTFAGELLNILQATVNGRNDLTILNKTPKQVDRMIQTLLTRI